MRLTEYYFDINGKKVPNEEAMAALLLKEDVLYLNNCKPYNEFDNKVEDNYTICLYCNINDIFCPGADGIEVSTHELPDLFEHYQKYDWWGVTIWAAKKLNMQPWDRRVESMKKDGVWSEDLEKLPKNKI
jgi:hypothetical protein